MRLIKSSKDQVASIHHVRSGRFCPVPRSSKRARQSILLVMRSQGAGAVFLLMLCGTTLPAFAQQSEQDAASRIVALENAWNRSSELKDLKALDRILNAAFIYVDDAGRLMTKAETLRDVKESKVRAVTLESIVVHLHGALPLQPAFI